MTLYTFEVEFREINDYSHQAMVRLAGVTVFTVNVPSDDVRDHPERTRDEAMRQFAFRLEYMIASMEQ